MTDAELDETLAKSWRMVEDTRKTYEKAKERSKKADAVRERAWQSWAESSRSNDALLDEWLRRRRADGPAEPSVKAPGLPLCALALGLTEWPATREQIVSAWRQQARTHHPDAGGTDEQFTAARNAYEQALRAIGVQP